MLQVTQDPKSSGIIERQERQDGLKSKLDRVADAFVQHINGGTIHHITPREKNVMKDVRFAVGLIVLVLEKTGRFIAEQRALVLSDSFSRLSVIECLQQSDVAAEVLREHRADDTLVRAFVGWRSGNTVEMTVEPMTRVEQRKFAELLTDKWGIFVRNTAQTPSQQIANLCFSKQAVNLALDVLVNEPSFLQLKPVATA